MNSMLELRPLGFDCALAQGFPCVVTAPIVLSASCQALAECRGREIELVMGRAVCDSIGWKRWQVAALALILGSR